MPYCTKCGKEIREGERCTCQQQQQQQQRRRTASSNISGKAEMLFGVTQESHNPKQRYERGMQIIPDNVAPDEGEIPVRQYNLCTLRSRIKFMRAEGRLQVTNKRVIFRAKGTSLTGPTVLQHEFAISELAGFQILRNFRFSVLDLLFGILLSAICFSFAQLIIKALLLTKGATFFGIIFALIGIAGTWYTSTLGKHFLAKLCTAAAATAFTFQPAFSLIFDGDGFGRFVGVLLMLISLAAAIQLLASVVLFSYKPNLDFNVCTKMGSGVIHLRCERAGFAAIMPMTSAVFTGYNEVLPTEETDAAIKEIGALVSDIQKLGDFAIEKWQRV